MSVASRRDLEGEAPVGVRHRLVLARPDGGAPERRAPVGVEDRAADAAETPERSRRVGLAGAASGAGDAGRGLRPRRGGDGGADRGRRPGEREIGA